MPICQDYYIFTVNFWFEKNCRLHLLYDTLSVLYDIFHRLAMQWYEVCNCVSLQIVSANLFVKTHKIDNTVYFSLHNLMDFVILRQSSTFFNNNDMTIFKFNWFEYKSYLIHWNNHFTLGNLIMNHAMAHAVKFFYIQDCIFHNWRLRWIFLISSMQSSKNYTSKMHSQDLTLLLKMHIYATIRYSLSIIV